MRYFFIGGVLLLLICLWIFSLRVEEYVAPRKPRVIRRKHKTSKYTRRGIERNSGEVHLGSGGQGKAFLTPEGYVRKAYYRETGYKNNKMALQKLTGEPHIPALIRYDDNKLEVFMEYCGGPLKEDTAPEDLPSQLQEINSILRKHKISNTDAQNRGNYCVKNGTLYLVDWGYCKDNEVKDIDVKRVVRMVKGKSIY